MIDGFSDQFGRKAEISVLAVNTGVLTAERAFAATIDFRNALAVSVLLEQWQHALVSSSTVLGPRYSNAFAIYPYAPSKDPERLIVHSPDLLGVDQASKFAGQTSPEIHTSRLLPQHVDGPLVAALEKQWRVRHLRNRRVRRESVLFRSLQIAMHALTMPYLNRATLHDQGMSLAAWVSAMEILVHPGGSGRAGLKEVVDLLQRCELNHPIVRRRAWVIRLAKRTTMRSNFVGKLYDRVYRARNAFLHGNAVTDRHVVASGKVGAKHLVYAAPVVYAKALQAYLHAATSDVGFDEDFASGSYAFRSNGDEALLVASGRLPDPKGLV
jgi:hypothetical protein